MFTVMGLQGLDAACSQHHLMGQALWILESDPLVFNLLPSTTCLRSAWKETEGLLPTPPEAFCGGLNEVAHVKVLRSVVVT